MSVAEFKPETFIQIVADSVDQIRRSDVFRLIDTCPDSCRNILYRYLRKHRPEFSGEIHDCCVELGLM